MNMKLSGSARWSALRRAACWEVEWEAAVYIGVTYRGITRRGGGDDSEGHSLELVRLWCGKACAKQVLAMVLLTAMAVMMGLSF